MLDAAMVATKTHVPVAPRHGDIATPERITASSQGGFMGVIDVPARGPGSSVDRATTYTNCELVGLDNLQIPKALRRPRTSITVMALASPLHHSSLAHRKTISVVRVPAVLLPAVRAAEWWRKPWAILRQETSPARLATTERTRRP